MSSTKEQALNAFLRKPDEVKVAGVCVGAFFVVIYLGFSLFYGVRWYGQAHNWAEVTGSSGQSAIWSGGRNSSSRYVSLQYAYNDQIYNRRVQLSREQDASIRRKHPGQTTSTVLLRVNPRQPNEIIVDPRVNIWEYAKTGLFFLFGTIIWYWGFDKVRKGVEKP